MTVLDKGRLYILHNSRVCRTKMMMTKTYVQKLRDILFQFANR